MPVFLPGPPKEWSVCGEAVTLWFDDNDKVVPLVFQSCFSGRSMLEVKLHIVSVLAFELCYGLR